LYDGKKVAARALQNAEIIKHQRQRQQVKKKIALALTSCVLCVGVIISMFISGEVTEYGYACEEINVPISYYPCEEPG